VFCGRGVAFGIRAPQRQKRSAVRGSEPRSGRAHPLVPRFHPRDGCFARAASPRIAALVFQVGARQRPPRFASLPPRPLRGRLLRRFD
jgi:hypothetical protein